MYAKKFATRWQVEIYILSDLIPGSPCRIMMKRRVKEMNDGDKRI